MNKNIQYGLIIRQKSGRKGVPTLGEFIEPSDLMMAVTALLQDKVPNTSSYLAKGFGDHLIEVWDATVHGIRGPLGFLRKRNFSMANASRRTLYYIRSQRCGLVCMVSMPRAEPGIL